LCIVNSLCNPGGKESCSNNEGLRQKCITVNEMKMFATHPSLSSITLKGYTSPSFEGLGTENVENENVGNKVGYIKNFPYSKLKVFVL
jgi:hypothetical protein